MSDLFRVPSGLPCKLFTGRYANAEVGSGLVAPIRITLGAPRMRLPGYVLAGELRELAPPRHLFHITQRSRFEPRYREHLDKIGLTVITQKLAALHEVTGQDLALLCFERVDHGKDWCHRLCFAKWWFDRTGEVTTEVPEVDPPRVLAAKAPRPEGRLKTVKKALLPSQKGTRLGAS